MSAAATPHALLSATASFPPTGSVTPALPPQPSTPTPTPGLPPPSTFDVLPDLHKVLTRLLTEAAQPAPPLTPGAAADGPLEIDQVASATADVKLKMQRARKAVMDLPDIDRTCGDQEEEIAHLEAKIASLKALLQGLAQPALEAEDPDQSHHTSPDCMDELYRVLGE